MAYSRAFLALLSCRLALGELRCIAGRAAPCTRCLSKDLQRHRLAPCGATAGDAQSCSPVLRESRQQKTALPKQSRKDTSEINQRLENWGARRAAFRPYSPDLDPKSPVFMRVFGLSSLSKPIGKPTKSRNFWCNLTQPECCVHNAAQFLRFIMCSPPIYLHTQNPRTACHAKEPQSAQIIFV